MMKGGFLILLALVVEGPKVESLYASARKYDKESFRFEPAAGERGDELRALSRELTHDALAGKKTLDSKEVARARKLGLELVKAHDDAGALWVLQEAGTRRGGDGFFVWRPRGVPLCIQAPHSFFDERTGDIGLEVFAQTHAVAFFTNTVHRYAPVAPGVPEGAADVAHVPRSLFQSATEGLLAARAVAIVQVHGFGPRDHLPAGVAAIVSDGTALRSVDAPIVRFRDALRAGLPGQVLLFGVDAHELGATTNVQGRSARGARAPFIHVELSPDARAASPGPARALAHALQEALALTN
jgi:hypothetical protein